jgi:hypothetical protein
MGRRVAALLATGLLALPLGACGGGGGGGGEDAAGGPPPLAIVATALAVGDVRYDYDQSLAATGGSGFRTWSIVPGTGTPPPGIALSATGRLSGRPQANGTYAFQVRAVDALDATQSASRLFSIAVGSLPVDLSTPHWGDVWVGDPCALTATLATSAVTFVLRSSATGASVTSGGAVPPSATYVAGPVPGRDVVRCTATNGLFVDVTIDVLPDPFANHVARFGTTDVWLADVECKLVTTHAYDSDFDATLAGAGLRGPAALGPTAADGLARAVVVRELLLRLNVMHGNFPDGSPAPGGLAISFPYERPEPPHDCPPISSAQPATIGDYNVMALHLRPETYGAWGLGYPEAPDNPNLENVTPTPQTPQGVFLAQIGPAFYQLYANFALPGFPVGPGDEATLRAMLYGLPPTTGARAAEVRRIAEGLSCALAWIVGHEIGHCIGQPHSADPTSPMWPSPRAFTPADMPIWSGDELESVRAALPGPNR